MHSGPSPESSRGRDLRFLDIGCGYGFALDLARFAWGWQGIGVDPSNLACRGREELGVDIRTVRFEPDVDLGPAPFDVVLASETLEHVPDPRALLGKIRDRLAPDGVLVMSTPNAHIVAPANPDKEVRAALSMGSHRCLVDRTGLERLLHDAGFASVEIDEDPYTLRAAASPTATTLTSGAAPAEPDLTLLARYCDARADSAPAGSPLRLGMAIRAVEYAIHAGDLATANAGCDRLRIALLDRHRIDLDDPAATSVLALQARVPIAAAAAHFSVGFLDLEARDRPGARGDALRGRGRGRELGAGPPQPGAPLAAAPRHGPRGLGAMPAATRAGPRGRSDASGARPTSSSDPTAPRSTRSLLRCTTSSSPEVTSTPRTRRGP